MSQRITIDPITRIEGHLRIDCEIENGKVTKAWSSGTMWRGMEEIVKGNDPRDAWMIVAYVPPSTPLLQCVRWKMRSALKCR